MFKFILGVIVGGVIATMSPWAYQHFEWMGAEAQNAIEQTKNDVDAQ